MRKTVWICLAGLALSALAVPQNQPKRGPSTAEERARFLALTRKLEQTPLDRNLYAEKKWALQWIEDIPDITVTPCPYVLGDEFPNSRYPYTSNLLFQVVFGSVAFMIEHPDKKDDQVAQYTAGVESALKAYKGILRADPVASRPLEELLQKQSEGKLEEFVKTASKECRASQQTGM
ncbi:MAG TPA: hypothetical protein VKL40_12580 [Candidatus Angelobacter sp.]|nr:hypothetical protein [Candidatus Angelobacter sp.]